MKIAIYYFSGTGNTEIVCKRWAEEAKKHNIECDLFKVEEVKDEKVDVSNYDKVGIAYPIHAFNAPKVLWKFTTKIAKLADKKPAFIIMVSGEYMNLNHSSDYKVARILKRRNILIESEYHYLMPYSFIFKHTDYMAYRMKKTMEGLLPLDLDRFLNGEETHMKRFFLDRPFAFILRIQWWGGRFNGLFYKVKKNECIKCMKCIQDCPAKNISYNEEKQKFHFGYQCLMCQRCIMYCPKHAIKVGMFNAWRVDGPYTFKEQLEFQKERHPRYCRKNYQRYFEVSEKRIKEGK